MKRKLRFLAGACLFTATALFSGCSSDDDFLMDPVDSGTSQTRAVTNPDGTLTITFDDFDPGMLAGPNLGRRKSLFVPRVSSSNHHLRQYSGRISLPFNV